MRKDELSSTRRSGKPLLVMYVGTSSVEDGSLDITQTFAKHEAKAIYEYLRFRSCKPVFTTLTNVPGVIRVAIGTGRNAESEIIKEMNQLGKDRGWDIRNFLEDFNEDRKSDH